MKILGIILNKFIGIKRNTCCFISFSGKCCDNPYFVSVELNKIAPWVKQYWIVDKKNINAVPTFATPCCFGTKKARRVICSSETIIDNVYGPFACQVFNNFKSKIIGIIIKIFGNKKGQKIYSVWHGNPIKKIGRDQTGNDVIDFVCGNLTIFSNSKKMQTIMDHVTFKKTKSILIGMPRNDLLFDNSDIASLKNKLHLPLDKKVVLFAPTFRNDGKDVENKNIMRSGLDQLNMIDFTCLFDELKKKFCDDFVFVARFHYHVSNMVDWNQLNRKYPGKIINGNLSEEMSLYLKCSDILMTDASSCAFDYFLTKKPCFLFFPDFENYEKNERGFYYDILSLPFPLSKTFDELIKNISQFNKEKYEQEVNSFIMTNEFVDDGNASNRIAEYVLKEMENR